jgi:EAL domain-containing protein (putative c-di-GMP-specific phosphodiesterase class I)
VELVKTIVALAQTLQMEVVGEGVETDEQLKLLKGLKCTYGQGHFFAKAMDAQSAAQWLSKAVL